MEYRMKREKRMAHLNESEEQEFLIFQKKAEKVEKDAKSKYEATFLKIKETKRKELGCVEFSA